MGKNANTILDIARGWIGRKESNGTHKEIIDVYNNHEPLARGYKVKYTDSWCATFVSACAIKAGYTDIIPLECSCNQMIKGFQKIGRWCEDDAHVPSKGDVIFYDWQDDGSGDNKGSSDHVGIVEKVEGNTITVIEGNKNDSVARRTLKVNGRYIRGYGLPKYDTSASAPKPQPQPQKPSDNWVDRLNAEIKRQGFKTYPLVKEGAKGGITKLIQERLNSVGFHLACDGIFGEATRKAVIVFQKNRGLTADGIVGANTWAWLIKGTKM